MCALNYCQVTEEMQGPVVGYRFGPTWPDLQQLLVQIPAVQALDRNQLLQETSKAIGFHQFNIQQKMPAAGGVMINVLVDRVGREPITVDVRIEVLGGGADPGAASFLSRMSTIRLVRTPGTVVVPVWVRNL
ncbi:MAG TPA: hypothetical protein VGK61_05230 [Planctomycetota bacterium]|jgi:hypothetical protein